MTLPIEPPLAPMLAKAAAKLPSPTSETGDMYFEPKWDGFRCIVFRDGDSVELGSRNDRPLTRYFPELIAPLRRHLPERCVVDGELVVATDRGLDFEVLGQRVHPAESRIARLSVETPASFVAFDVIALGSDDLRSVGFAERRRQLEHILRSAEPPILLTPITRDRAQATDWFERFEGAGFDGVMAKPGAHPYVPGKRTIHKIKHQRTADVVVAGYRIHKDGNGVGSLLLGLHDASGQLHHIGVASGFSAARRGELVEEVAPYESGGLDGHPWADWGNPAAHDSDARLPGAPSRWSGGKNQRWVPLRRELVAEVGYQGLTSLRLRHPAKFVRWRPDKQPVECAYDQLDQAVPTELRSLFAGGEFG